MSEIFYAGGTATKDISAADLINDLREKGINAHFVEHRENLVKEVQPHIDADSVMLLMGAGIHHWNILLCKFGRNWNEPPDHKY